MSRRRIDIAKTDQLPLTHEATIPEDYLDLMGHMNVMWYTHLFSISLMRQFHSIGLDRDYMEAHHAGSFALEAHIRYLSEVLEGHRVGLHSRMLGRSEKRLHVIHFMVNHDKGDLSATMEIVATHVDMQLRRSAPFPPSIADRIDELAARHEALDWPAPTCGSMKP